MKASLFLFLIATGCGGEVLTGDAGDDATTADAPIINYDIDAHWGECCLFSEGGVGRTCKDADPGVQCASAQYCGLQFDVAYNENPPFTACCGDQLNTPPATQLEVGCLPWPGLFLESQWGECCYSHLVVGDIYGGVPGPCPKTGPEHTQCASDRYCGQLGQQEDDGGNQLLGCCGNRADDLGTMDHTGVDPKCPPVAYAF